MPLIPNALERFLFMTLNQAPAALIDIFSAAGLRVVVVAADAGVFDHLEERPLSVNELAARTGADRSGLAVLLPVLDSFGYVMEKAGKYANTPHTSSWLLSSSPGRILDFLRWWKDIVYRYWDTYLELSIRNGERPPNLYDWISEQPDGWQIAQAGFEATALLALSEVVNAIDLPDSRTSLLDVGGGHGLYSIELCRMFPNLTATIFDLPDALGRARENIDSQGLQGRVDVKAGDYLQDDLGQGYGAALVFNVIHAQADEQNGQLLRRVAKALKGGGRVFIMDQMEEPKVGNMSRATHRLLSLAYHVGMSGKTYTYPEVRSWLLDAGFSDVSRKGLPKIPGTLIVSATKP
jgi:precorrin-6B methylase 2